MVRPAVRVFDDKYVYSDTLVFTSPLSQIICICVFYIMVTKAADMSPTNVPAPSVQVYNIIGIKLEHSVLISLRTAYTQWEIIIINLIKNAALVSYNCLRDNIQNVATSITIKLTDIATLSLFLGCGVALVHLTQSLSTVCSKWKLFCNSLKSFVAQRLYRTIGVIHKFTISSMT